MMSIDSAQAETKPPFLYRCSFCAKPQTEVKKLIAGPGVFICDECVGLCLPIIENATEESEKPAAVGLGPAGASTEQLVTVLKGYNGAFETVGNTMQALVDILRKREVSWAVIGDALGVSRQAAWKRFG